MHVCYEEIFAYIRIVFPKYIFLVHWIDSGISKLYGKNNLIDRLSVCKLEVWIAYTRDKEGQYAILYQLKLK